jgi:2-oxoglutarate dehydrogenase E1 component
MERMLMLSAEENIRIAVPTTPAQFFHLLRRQTISRWRKPLIVFTPKSLLRHAEAVSSLEELSEGRFRRVIPDEGTHSDKHPIRRVLLCSGKLYYELRSHREEQERNDVAIVRIEQIYPFPELELQQALAHVPDETPVVWVQEEPANMGAWSVLKLRIGQRLFDCFPFTGITRPESASPATGSKKSHTLEQTRLLNQAFKG